MLLSVIIQWPGLPWHSSDCHTTHIYWWHQLTLTGPGEWELASRLYAFIKHIWGKGKKDRSRKIQGFDTTVKCLGTHGLGHAEKTVDKGLVPLTTKKDIPCTMHFLSVRKRSSAWWTFWDLEGSIYYLFTRVNWKSASLYLGTVQEWPLVWVQAAAQAVLPIIPYHPAFSKVLDVTIMMNKEALQGKSQKTERF